MASNDNQASAADTMSRHRRSSVTSAALSSLFRSNSTSSASTGTPIFPGPITSAALDQNLRRRLSISTTAALGLSGTSPISAGAVGPGVPGGGAGAGAGGVGGSAGSGGIGPALRRASLSTNSSSSVSDGVAADESAIDDDDVAVPGGLPRTVPNTPITPSSAPYGRRLSFGAQAMAARNGLRGPGGVSPGGASSNDQGYNWSEQLRSRAESTVASGAAARPSFSFASSAPRSARRDSRPKPDPFQERILKGDFYMD